MHDVHVLHKVQTGADSCTTNVRVYVGLCVRTSLGAIRGLCGQSEDCCTKLRSELCTGQSEDCPDLNFTRDVPVYSQAYVLLRWALHHEHL